VTVSNDWVVDKGLDVLLRQIDEAAPSRSKKSDGSIGDPDHAARDSDHNPESPPPPGNPDNEVDARDFTHDPAHNADMGVVTEAIRKSRDRRVSYIIFDRRITGPNHNWEWDDYTGDDPHTGHAHVSVNDTHNDETQLWEIGIDDVMTAAQQYVQHVMNYRLDAIIHMRLTNNVPALTTTDGSKYPAFSEPNHLASKITEVVTKIDTLLTGGVPPADMSIIQTQLADIQKSVHGLINGVHANANAVEGA
jgi:hypothetical protein